MALVAICIGFSANQAPLTAGKWYGLDGLKVGYWEHIYADVRLIGIDVVISDPELASKHHSWLISVTQGYETHLLRLPAWKYNGTARVLGFVPHNGQPVTHISAEPVLTGWYFRGESN